MSLVLVEADCHEPGERGGRGVHARWCAALQPHIILTSASEQQSQFNFSMR